MSRIGKMPVTVPDGVSLRLAGRSVSVLGPKGSLDLDLPPFVELRVDGNQATVHTVSGDVRASAMQGLARALVRNMVEGVSRGFQKTLQIEGVGYQARVDGNRLILQIGFCHEVVMDVPGDLEVEVPARTKNIIVRGADKQLVGQFAANVRRVRPPEPYKGKGIRYLGETVRRKAGKAQVGTA